MPNLDAYGKHKTTTFDFDLISDELFNEIQTEFYKKPEYKEVVREMRRLLHGYTDIGTITDYYFRDLMWDCIRHNSVYSVNEIMHDKTLMSYAYSVLYRRANFFTPDENLIRAFITFFGLSSGELGGSVAQFPFKTISYILDTYNTNNNYYDFSCGWGCRLTGAMLKGINYFGTDPNYKLVPILNQYAEDWKKECDRTSSVKIYCQGSEHFIPELEGKMGLAFSSTPYFKLEDYRYGEQSCNKDSYEDWVNEYLRPTIQNIYRYLTDTGYFLLNIKNYKNYTMEEDVQKISIETGFELEKLDDLNMYSKSARPRGNGEMITTTEPVFVFHKKGFVPTPIIKSKVDLW